MNISTNIAQFPIPRDATMGFFGVIICFGVFCLFIYCCLFGCCFWIVFVFFFVGLCYCFCVCVLQFFFPFFPLQEQQHLLSQGSLSPLNKCGGIWQSLRDTRKGEDMYAIQAHTLYLRRPHNKKQPFHHYSAFPPSGSPLPSYFHPQINKINSLQFCKSSLI